MRHRLRSIFAKPYTFFAAPDVFISYARSDGTSYAEAIAAFLADTKFKFSCHIDQWDTAPGVRIPASILRAARMCHAAVIVGSPAGLASQAVRDEVKELTASKRTLVIIELPSSPLSAAVWYPLIQGIAPVRETGDLAAVLAGAPSRNVLNRLENAFVFWRRNRRIKFAAWAGTAVLAVAATASALFSEQAARSRNIALATERSIRAQDMLSQDRAKSMDAVRLAMESMAIARTSWGESALRRSLLLMPTHQSLHQIEPAKHYIVLPRRRSLPARIDGEGNVVTWSYTGREDNGNPVFKVRVTNARTGNPTRPEFEVKGLITDLRFFDTTLVIETSGMSNGGRGLVLAAKEGPAVRSLPQRGRSVAINSDGSLALIINDEVELWSLRQGQAALQRWPLSGISSAAFSVDGKSIYAVRNDALIIFDAEAENSEPKILSQLARPANDSGERLFATGLHLAVQIGSRIKIWNIERAEWEHEISSHVDAEIVLLPGDRLADWSSSGVAIWDLSARAGVDFLSTRLHSDCGEDRERRIRLLDFQISSDGSRAAMACANGVVKVISALDATPLASAPFDRQVPWATGIDSTGRSFFAVTHSPGRAFVSEWINLTGSSPQIGGGEVARLSRSISLSRNGTVVGVFHSPQGSKLITFNSETGALKVYDWGQGSFLHAGQSGKRVAFVSGSQIKIAKLGESDLLLEGMCPALGDAMAISFGEDENVLAASVSTADGARVTVCRRTAGRWEAERTIDAESWTVDASPDPIELSPLAVSARGSLAYLGRGRSGQELGHTIHVQTFAGRRFIVEQPAQVTALAFAQDETLVIGDRSGGVRTLSTRELNYAMRTLGRHTGRIVAIAASKDSRVLSVGSDDIVRMWDLNFTEDMIGVSGVMEFPLVPFGISGLSYVGAVSVALNSNRLITLNQHARGVFAHIWNVPTGANLMDEARIRLGPSFGIAHQD